MPVSLDTYYKLLLATRHYKETPSEENKQIFLKTLEEVRDQEQREQKLSVLEPQRGTGNLYNNSTQWFTASPFVRRINKLSYSVVSGLVAAVIVILFFIVFFVSQPGQNLVFGDLKSEFFETLTVTSAPTSDAIMPICGGEVRISREQGGQGVFRRDLGVTLFTQENNSLGLLGKAIRAVEIDTRGVWYGYYPMQDGSVIEGIGQFDRESWEVCRGHEEEIGQNTNDIAIDGVGNVWVATDGYGVNQFDGSTWHTYTVEDGLPDNRVYTIQIDDSNNVWIGTWQGIAKFDGDKWVVVYSVADETNIVNDHISSILFHPNGEIWVGYIDAGVSRYNAQGQWIYYSSELNQSSLPSNNIRGIITDDYNDVWIATDGGGVSKFNYDNESWEIFNTTNSNLLNNNIRDIALDKFGRVWVATQNGVNYFDGIEWEVYALIDTYNLAFGPTCDECPYWDVHVWLGTVDSGLASGRLPATSDVIQVVDVEYPKTVSPGEEFSPKTTVRVLPGYDLLESEIRGDSLRYIGQEDTNLFGAHEIIPVEREVNPGATYTFSDSENSFTAPLQPGIYRSTWRVWQDGRYVGDSIEIEFTVLSNTRSSS